MKRILIRTGTGEARNAAGKARQDADALAVRAGYEPFVFRGARTGEGSLGGALRLAVSGLGNWLRLIRRAEKGSLVLFQYPHYPMKSSLLARRMIPLGQKLKGLRFIALVHDLDSLRGLHGKAAVYSDRQVLPRFDVIICHNDRMKEKLVSMGIPAEKLVPLGIFDYLTKAPGNAGGEGIAAAGNLSPEKSGYILRLAEQGTVPLHLYGKGLEGTAYEKKIRTEGSFPPEELPGKLKGRWGLVWDGPESRTCAGPAGEYLRINNPHKLSLYMAAGLPVIIWREAALAGFVLERGAGIAVERLDGLEKVLDGVSEEEYEGMRRAAAEIGKEVRDGGFLTAALKEADKILSQG